MKSWHHLPDLYFLHIPKTAGTSIRAFLEGFFPAKHILPGHQLMEMESAPDEDIQNCHFARGHYGWRFVDRAESLNKRFAIITFLRDAVSLRLSRIQYINEIPERSLGFMPQIVAERMRRSIEASKAGLYDTLVEREEITPAELDEVPDFETSERNLMVRSLVGPGVQTTAPIPVDETTLEVAKEHLLSTHFGIVEDMEKSWIVIFSSLGLPFLGTPSKKNVAKKRLQPSLHFLELLQQIENYDTALYEFGKRNLEYRYKSLRQPTASSAREAFLKTDRGVDRIKEATIGMGDGLITEGFAQRLFNETYQRWIRWANKDATVYLPIDPTDDRMVRFEVAATMNEKIRDGLRLSVNSRDIPLTRTYEKWEDGTYHLICEGTIPKSALDPNSQYTALHFVSPEEVKTSYPQQMGELAAWALAAIYVKEGQPVISAPAKPQVVRPIREGRITMEADVLSDGFASSFYHEPYGRWIRWAGKVATVYLPIDPTENRTIRFEVAATLNDTIRDGLKLLVNGRTFPVRRSYEKWNDNAFHLICEAKVPFFALDAASQYTAFTFVAPEEVETDYPVEMGASAAWALADIAIS